MSFGEQSKRLWGIKREIIYSVWFPPWAGGPVSVCESSLIWNSTRDTAPTTISSLSLSPFLTIPAFFLPSNEILLRLSRWGEANEVKESEAWLSPAQIIYSITKMVNPKVTERQSWELSWGFCGRWLGWAEFWHSHGQKRNLRWLKKYWVLRRGKLPSSDIFKTFWWRIFMICSKGWACDGNFARISRLFLPFLHFLLITIIRSRDFPFKSAFVLLDLVQQAKNLKTLHTKALPSPDSSHK